MSTPSEALHAQEFDEGAVRAVLEGLAPWNLRVMWASKRFKVRCCARETPPKVFSQLRHCMHKNVALASIGRHSALCCRAICHST